MSTRDETDTLEALLEAHRAIQAMGPMLGAVIAVEGWRPGVSVELTVDDMDQKAWRALELLVESEAVERVRRNAGRKVILIAEADLIALRKQMTTSRFNLLGTPVYTARTASLTGSQEP